MNQQTKQSHQIKALMLKNIRLQARQPCTNVCQILTPIICLLFAIMIRNIAISKIPNDNDSIFKRFPTIPQKFNDFSLQVLFPKLVDRKCTQWYSYQIKNNNDIDFIGHKNGTLSDGLLGKISDTSSDNCTYNLSKTSPFTVNKFAAPIFLTKNESVNIDIFDSFQYMNNISDRQMRNTSVLDKIADGAVTFYTANKKNLTADLKINDLRQLDYHRSDGITRIRYYNNKTEGKVSYYLIAEGFLTFQHIITSAFIELVTNKSEGSGYLYMPFQDNSSIFVDILVNTVTTIIFPISLSLLLPVFLYLIVLEKEEKLIQMMRMNGMKMRNYWFVNFLFSLVISIITNLIFFFFGYFFMDNAFFNQTGKDVIFVILFGWILAQIGMSTFFQVFLTTSRAANIIGYLISIWTNLIGATLSIAIYQFPRPLPNYFVFYPTFAFNRLFYLLFTQCSAGRCFTSLSSLSTEARTCVSILYISFAVFQLMGMYLFEIIPQQYGTRRPILFPIKFIASKFSKRKEKNELSTVQFSRTDRRLNNDESAKNEKRRISDIANLEDYPLVISNLKKIYDNGKKAVKGLDLLISDNQVFGLLGPNGAGKTTLISMITGVFQSSDGDCFVAGNSIRTQIEKVHLYIGVCPQFDILWPQLTVEEHLYFYTRLRGTSKNLQATMVKKALNEVNLTQFKNFKASQLSGGMKRRLSVGISMVGDPRIVFLDEPTTGLDPENRRNLWDVLNKCRQNRALFLTTHLMEEADALCNRIGIITNGVLRTVGTQQYLKKTYGDGYYLSLNLQMQRPQAERNKKGENVEYSSEELVQKSQSILSYPELLEEKQLLKQSRMNKEKVKAIKQEIHEIFPQAKVDREINGFLRFNLGNVVISQVMSKLAKSEFPQIRQNWGLTNSNLEDVFLAVVNKFDKDDTLENQGPDTNMESGSLVTEGQQSRNSIQEQIE